MKITIVIIKIIFNRGLQIITDLHNRLPNGMAFSKAKLVLK